MVDNGNLHCVSELHENVALVIDKNVPMGWFAVATGLKSGDISNERGGTGTIEDNGRRKGGEGFGPCGRTYQESLGLGFPEQLA